MAQISENSLRSSSWSISFARLSGDESARNVWYSSSVGNGARDVDRHPAQKFFVGAEFAGQDPQRSQLGADQLVDVVAGRSGAACTSSPSASTSTWLPTVFVSKRAITNASPRSAAVTRPSSVIGRRVVVVRCKGDQVGHVAIGAVAKRARATNYCVGTFAFDDRRGG